MKKSGAEVKIKPVFGGSDNRDEVATTELNSRQKKIWLAVLFGALILIVGLLITIVVVVNNQDSSGECTNCENTQDLTEKKKKQRELEEATTVYASTIDEITKVVGNLDPDDTSVVIYTYQYYIDNTDNELAKLMLESLFLQVQMGYDTDNIKGEELINKALEIDEKLKTADSAVLVMNLASNYNKTELYNKYETILNERETAEGIDTEMETKG